MTKQAGEQPQNRQQQAQKPNNPSMKKNIGTKKAPVDMDPGTQWPGPLDRPLGFSER